MKLRRLLQIAGACAIALIVSSCEELPPYVQHPLAAFAPQPSGYWNDEGVSGSPKIVVHIGEQRLTSTKVNTWSGNRPYRPANLGSPPLRVTIPLSRKTE